MSAPSTSALKSESGCWHVSSSSCSGWRWSPWLPSALRRSFFATLLFALENLLRHLIRLNARIHRHERAFAQRSKPRLLTSSELASAGFDCLDARLEARVAGS